MENIFVSMQVSVPMQVKVRLLLNSASMSLWVHCADREACKQQPGRAAASEAMQPCVTCMPVWLAMRR